MPGWLQPYLGHKTKKVSFIEFSRALLSSEFVIVLLVAVSEPNLDVRTVSSFRLARLVGLLSWSCEHGR